MTLLQEEDVAFRSGAVTLAGTLLAPRRAGTFPAVILAAGSGHHDRDESLAGKRPFRSIATYLARRGWLVLRFDSRGVGASGGTIAETTFDSKVADLRAAHAFLCADRRVDRRRMAFAGHSEGGLTALACARHTASPVAMLAGPATAIEPLLHRQAWLASSAAGATPAQLAHERAMNERVFALVRDEPAGPALERRVNIAILEALQAWPQPPWDPGSDLAASARQMTAIVTAADYRTLLRQDPPALLAAFPYPVAAFYGEFDRQVEAVPNLAAFRRATAHNPAAFAVVLPCHNHLFQEASTGALDEYERLDPTPSEALLASLASWLGRVTGDAGG